MQMMTANEPELDPEIELVVDAVIDTVVDAVIDVVTTSFEACSGFGPADHGSPVCGACGWLDHEHAGEVVAEAEIHVLVRRRRNRSLPKRMAS